MKKLIRKIIFTVTLPLRKKFDGLFFSEEPIYLVIPFNKDKVLDIDRVVIHYNHEDAVKESEYLKNRYDYVTIKPDYLNFNYIEE